MAISFGAIGEEYVSFTTGSGAAAGKVCVVTADKTVGTASENAAFCGVVREVRDGVAGVQMHGYVELPYSGTSAPALGYASLVADKTGGVCTSMAGRSYLVVHVDSTNKIVGLFL